MSANTPYFEIEIYDADDETDWSEVTLSYLGPSPSNLAEAFAITREKWRIIREMVEKYHSDKTQILDGGVRTCGLCMMYWASDCCDCPIFGFTGNPGCRGTPYETFRYHSDVFSDNLYRVILNDVKDEQELLEELENSMVGNPISYEEFVAESKKNA